MEIIGSLAAIIKKEAGGFVGYPRQYVGNEIHGVDQAGKPFILVLDIPSNFIEAAKKQSDINIPDVATLQETHRRARNPCIAMEDNGPLTKSGGAFLAEQVEVVDLQKGSFKARWLSILKDWETSPEPRIAAGYLETSVMLPLTAETEGKKLQLKEMNQTISSLQSAGSNVDQVNGVDLIDYVSSRDDLALELYQTAKKWFIGVDVQYRRIELAQLDNEALIRRQVLELIESNSVNGMYGGVIMRPIKTEGGKRVVQMDAIRRLNHQYDYKLKAVPDVATVWNAFVPKGSGWMKYMKREGFDVEIIPIQRVNCAPMSGERYAKEYNKGLPKQLKAFVDKEFYFSPYVNFAQQNACLVAPIAMRTADSRKAEHAGNFMLSTLHAFGKPLGNAMELDKDLQREYQMSASPVPFVRGSQTRLEEPSLDS
jgi:hypothetical protein